MFRSYEERNKNGSFCTKEEYNELLNKLKSFETETLNIEKCKVSFRDFRILFPTKSSDFYLDCFVNFKEKLPKIEFKEYSKKMENVYPTSSHETFYNILSSFF